MRPKERRETGEGDLFRSRLDQIIDMKHALVKLAQAERAWRPGGRIGADRRRASWPVAPVRVFHPALAQHLVGGVVHVLDDGEPRHQSRREWRMTRRTGMNGPRKQRRVAVAQRMRGFLTSAARRGASVFEGSDLAVTYHFQASSMGNDIADAGQSLQFHCAIPAGPHMRDARRRGRPPSTAVRFG
jgi:hypothetical protein